jgi:hypothetical protein
VGVERGSEIDFSIGFETPGVCGACCETEEADGEILEVTEVTPVGVEVSGCSMR